MIMGNDCVFCDSANFKDRIVAENDDYFIVATLGQITNGGYLLLIPKYHVKCFGELTLEQTDTLKEAGKDILRLLWSAYKIPHKDGVDPYPIIMFEHGIVGQTVEHAHLHFLPTATDLTKRIHADFPNAEVEELQKAEQLRERYQEKKEPYLFWTTPSCKTMACWNPPAAPQYLRLITAELLGRPERGNWRDMNPELDKQLYSKTVTHLKRYFMRCNWTT